jgi:hypothetical protein
VYLLERRGTNDGGLSLGNRNLWLGMGWQFNQRVARSSGSHTRKSREEEVQKVALRDNTGRKPLAPIGGGWDSVHGE